MPAPTDNKICTHPQDFNQVRSTIIFWCLAIVSAAAVYAVLYQMDYRQHFLNGDEVAVVTSTRDDSWRHWFTQGYSKYFIIYPDWFNPSSFELLRPTMHFLMWVGIALFSANYALHFALYFLVIVAMACLFRRILQDLGVRPMEATWASLLFMISPAVVCEGLLNIPFWNDVWAVGLVLAAFYALLRGWLLATLVFLVLAVFNKESVWYAPVAACISWGILYRDRFRSSLLLLPLVAILIARFVVFGSLFGNAMADKPNFTATLIQFARGGAIWPTGTVELSAITMGKVNAALLINAALVTANVAFWIGLATAAFFARYQLFSIAKAVIAGRYIKTEPDQRTKLLLVVFVFLLGALSFGIPFGHRDPRYGASIYAFLLMAAAILISMETDKRIFRRLGLSIQQVLAFAFLVHSWTWWQATFVDGSHSEKKLHAALTSMSSSAKRVYVVGAPDTFPSPRYLPRAWNLPFEVTYVNQFIGCETADVAGASLLGNHLLIHVPDCAQIVFRGADNAVLAKGMVAPLEREGVGTYSFVAARPKKSRFDPRNLGQIDFGDTVEVSLSNLDDLIVLSYDWRAGDYRVLSRQ
jgi:hypothetical protein